ncbi:MAG: hypothetical protein JO200_08455 [Comamonas sp.]|nr:hypothetical protein [Comamonas sp.]
MKEHTVFVVEKLSTLRKLAPHLSSRWPGKVYAITTLYLGLYEFRYPRGLSMADFPFVGEPTWKVRHQEQSPAFEIQGDEAHRCALDPVELLRGASSICFAADPDPAGAVAFHVLLSECLGDASARASWPALRLRALDERSISSAPDAAGATSDDWFESMRNAGIARRFFDFNYNINALALFGQALRQVGGLSRDYLVSKYSLQLLYALRDWPPARSDGALIHAMENWQGTGRYTACGMGSPASRLAILTGLRSAGLVDGVALTASGRAFLNGLHPDCCDQDLPGRIGEWEQHWPASRPKMERYLRTFFGKQKRYAQEL